MINALSNNECARALPMALVNLARATTHRLWVSRNEIGERFASAARWRHDGGSDEAAAAAENT